MQKIAAALLIAVTAAAGYLGFEILRTTVAVTSNPLDRGIVGEKLDRGERVNLLLLGYGGGAHDGANLTDSIMLVSLDPATNAVALVSVPRDLWVTVATDRPYQGKVNEAFAAGADQGDRDAGIRIATATLEPVLGVEIDKTIALDFTAFRAVVDAVGGIDVTVDRAFSARYPKNDDPSVDPSWITVSFAAGAQRMDGETALRYSRARYAEGVEGSDFARAARQQKVVLATRRRVEETRSVATLLGLLGALRDNVRTDLSVADMRSLAAFSKGYDDARTVRAALTTENVLVPVTLANGAYTLQPRTRDWSGVHAYVAEQLASARAATR